MGPTVGREVAVAGCAEECERNGVAAAGAVVGEARRRWKGARARAVARGQLGSEEERREQPGRAQGEEGRGAEGEGEAVPRAARRVWSYRGPGARGTGQGQ